VEGVASQRVLESDDQFVDACFLIGSKPLADGVERPDQAVAEAARKYEGRPRWHGCPGLLVGVRDDAVRRRGLGDGAGVLRRGGDRAVRAALTLLRVTDQELRAGEVVDVEV
jgi:hypothetical protein